MASNRMHDLLLAISSNAEWATRPHISETQARMSEATDRYNEIRCILAFSRTHTDREVVAVYPDLMKRWMPRGWWDKLKPKEATDGE